MQEEGLVVLDVLFSFKDLHVLLMNVEAKYLSDEYSDLLQLPIDHLHPAHGKLSVDLVRFLSMDVQYVLLVCLGGDHGLYLIRHLEQLSRRPVYHCPLLQVGGSLLDSHVDVFGDSFTQHVNHVLQVLDAIRVFRLLLNDCLLEGLEFGYSGKPLRKLCLNLTHIRFACLIGDNLVKAPDDFFFFFKFPPEFLYFSLEFKYHRDRLHIQILQVIVH